MEDEEIKHYWSKLLIFLIVVGFGYLSYYKFMIYDKRDINTNTNVVDNNSNTNENEKEENNSKGNNEVEKEKANILTRVGSLVSLLSNEEKNTEFKNLKKEYNGISVVFNCTDFDSSPLDPDTKTCLVSEVIYNNVLKLNLNIIAGENWHDVLYQNENYYVIVKTGGILTEHSIIIYNSNGKLLSTIGGILYDTDDTSNVEGRVILGDFKYIKFIGNEIHFVKTEDEDNKDNIYYVIDLSSKNLKNIEPKKVEKKDAIKKIAVTNPEIKKYYEYISAEDLIAEDEYDFNYFNNNKNQVALRRVVDSKNIIIKNCADYDVMENTANPNVTYICYTDDQFAQGCVSSFNKDPNAKVNVLPGKYLKEAVEQIYGKGSYVAENFYASSHLFQYVNSTDEYIELTHCGGGMSAKYVAELYLAEKGANVMYLYEKITGTTFEEVKTKEISIKHTFEKNSYDNNYHYVKSEEA